jgi:hypothetical protein
MLPNLFSPAPSSITPCGKAVATQYAPQSFLPRAQFDNTLRWKAVATQYAPKPLLNRIQAAEAARWSALAGNYAAQNR